MEIVTYAPSGPLSHILAGVPGIVRDTGRGFAVVEFGAILEPVERRHLVPARLWSHRTGEPWGGPHATVADGIAALGGVPGLERAGEHPDGSEIISGGRRYRLAWSGDGPPSRFGT